MKTVIDLILALLALFYIFKEISFIFALLNFFTKPIVIKL